MSYQQQGFPQQQQQQLPGQFGAGAAAPRTNPATAVLTGLLALVAAGAIGLAAVAVFNELDGGFGDLPGELKTILVLRVAGAALLLIGAILVFARKMAGAILTVLGALATIASVLLLPVLAEMPMSRYFELIFQFEDADSIGSVVALFAAPLALIFAILPSTLRHLRRRAGNDYEEPQGQQPVW
ncbi:MAG TPA: hypothetical protein VFV67_15315 [Actinophytocola sp.]|uniref:hypothetical protein n=1 Tax=Actinophytocola sp. TaxID=1872138 RepID=UPI002DBBE14D|nr:hypothetical protein [Actinophytocola sp.]HEU5472020.1 hypothetical protein [Actinophytocola sp.]